MSRALYMEGRLIDENKLKLYGSPSGIDRLIVATGKSESGFDSGEGTRLTLTLLDTE